MALVTTIDLSGSLRRVDPKSNARNVNADQGIECLGSPSEFDDVTLLTAGSRD
jgi:hypothetical protein